MILFIMNSVCTHKDCKDCTTPTPNSTPDSNTIKTEVKVTNPDVHKVDVRLNGTRIDRNFIQMKNDEINKFKEYVNNRVI